MHLFPLLRDVDIVSLHCPADLSIFSIVSDSRRAVPGCLFLCLSGSRTNGHLFIREAVSRGAAAVVMDTAHPAPEGIPAVVVENTRLAASKIWNNYYGDPTKNMKVIAVTGTNGKTSTSYILRAILNGAGMRTALIGTVRCLCGDEEIPLDGGGEIPDIPSAMTTPDPEFLYGIAAEMKKRGSEVLILEVSSHALSLHKADALKMDLGIFTNLSPEHLDYHGTMDAYLRAKARLFKLVPEGILNADDPAAETIAELMPDCRYIRCSPRGNEGNVRALRTRMRGLSGVEYLYFSDSAVFGVQCGVPGRFTVENTLLAAAAARQMGVDPLTIREAIASFPGVTGRMERVLLPEADFSLFLDYAHTPEALRALLQTVRDFRRPGQRIVLLFGCGGDRDPSKRPEMGRIASSLADFVILTSDNSRSESPQAILNDILRGVDKEKPHTVIADRREAIAYAVQHAQKDDILLFAGKGHETYEITGEGKFPFDERETAREAFARRSR